MIAYRYPIPTQLCIDRFLSIIGQEPAAEFTLPNTRMESVSLSSLLKTGPVVLNFYRGAWCPYCTLELKALRDALPEITALGASLVSILPNVIEKSAAFAAENPFDFDILS